MKNSTLKPWDGTAPGTTKRYPVERYPDTYFISEDGTIYYKSSIGELCIWCAAIELKAHLHYLARLGVIVM